MKNMLIIFFALTFQMLLNGCELQHWGALEEPDAIVASGAKTSSGKLNSDRRLVERPFKMSRSNIHLEWAVIAPQEQICSGKRIAGGSTVGKGNFTHLGLAEIEMSAAWDIDRLIATPQFVPEGPAGGPVATVLSGSEYPYQFGFNPFTQQCGPEVIATGELVLTAANGDKLFGEIVSGETHRLDFLAEGDGIENFSIIEVVGGTGRFQGATGSFIIHTISRFDPAAGRFVIDLAEVMPGGTIAY
jgi:hypothetical protein